MAIWTVPGYRHERELGSGGTGRVVLARHEATGTPVAIKYLVRSLHSAADFHLAYRNEAVLLGALRTPNVASLYEYVEGEQGAAIVMELVEGVTLRELLRTEGATAPEAALAVLKGSLLGLAAAHEAGVVHRDYKPENVLITPQGVSKLVDFGIAARSGDTGAAAGTPLYMAPEQFSGEPAEPPTDVYAATATFFECVTGSRPYSGTTVNELMIQHTQSPIPDELAPEHVRSLIRSGLAKSPQDRPPSAAAFVEALEDAARAGYGEDWEEQGQRKLATLVAMLPLLLLGNAPSVPSATTALATTDLGTGKPPQGRGHERERGRKPRLSSKATKALISTVAAGAVIGAVALAAAARGNGTNDAGPGTIAAGYNATSGATTSVAPTPSSGLQPSTSAQPTSSVHPSTSSSASSTASASPSVAAGQLTPSSGASSNPTAGGSSPTTPATGSTSTTSATTPPPPPSSPPPPPPTLHVDSVSIKSLQCSGNNFAAATVEVLSDGAAAGTLYLAWYYTDANGANHAVSTVPVTIPAGDTDFVNSTPYYENFGGQGVYWGLTVSTSPAAARGNDSTATLLVATCEIQ